MRIAIFETEPWEHAAFQPLAEEHALDFHEAPLTADNAAVHREAEAVSTFIYSQVTPAVLERLPRLRLIATRSTGFDHIAREACAARGITLCNVPAYGDHTVAEHVFALLLAISHHLVPAVDRTRRGDFSLKGLQGFDLQGKTLGVIGTGSIGRNVIRIARGFDMRVLACDLAPDPRLADSLGFTYVDLPELLGAADILTLHVPGNDRTRHLLAAAEFARMKPGVVLINTARGDIVDVHALAGAIAEGRVAAAGLDVLPEEPVIREEMELLRTIFRERKRAKIDVLLADHILLRLRNVLITPHSGFNTREAVGRILDTTVANIASFAAGRPRNVVAPPEAS